VLPLLLTESNGGLFELGLACVASARRSGNHTVQTCQTQEQRQQTQTARPLEAKGQVGGGRELVYEGQSGGRVEESSQDRVVSEVVLSASPRLEGRTRQSVFAGELALRGAGGALLLAKLVQEFGIGTAAVAWGSGRGLGGGRLSGHSSAPWWRGVW
jgi:hypothetical protein